MVGTINESVIIKITTKDSQLAELVSPYFATIKLITSMKFTQDI